MKRAFATMAVALAVAALPSASIAERAQRAAIGVAIHVQGNRVLVAEVMRGGTGDLMGVRADDVITHAGGRPINSEERLADYIRRLNVGDPVELTVRRRGESLQLTGTAMARR
ncbi:MAG TPA: PDZ domain-containing protein [Allosphingosinicella sp.]|nr:PDZ domain-containing protein [Allosphingosinicella sp.]